MIPHRKDDAMKAKSAFFRFGCLFFLAALGAAFSSRAATPFPAKIHAGAIERMERTSDPIIFVKLDEAMAKDDVNPVDVVPDWLRAEITPADGEVFLVFTIAIQADRTLSTLDYRLQAGGAEHECKGMALESNNAFDLRRVVQKGPAVVKLLFSCPATAEEATLLNAFPNVPLTPVPTITLLEKATPPPEPAEPAPEAEKAPEAATAAPGAATAAPGAETAPEAETAAPEGNNDAAPAATKAAAETDPKAETAPNGKKPAPKTAAADEKPAAKDEKPAAKPVAKPAENVWF